MIAWMLQSLLAAAMIAAAGVALEEGARLLGRPLRWGWVGAMAAVAALPAVFRFLPASTAVEEAGGPVDPALLAALLAEVPSIDGSASLLDRLLHGGAADPLLISAWGALAMVMTAALLLAHARLRRVRASADRTEIAGFPALLTRSTGPMVVGVRRPEVVVPRWIGELPAAEQRLILRHEWEHVCAGDTRLLLAAAVLVAAMPWNLPLWWMRRRLRQAIEVDCDARVLAAGADRRLYGGMLIRTAGRPRPTPLLAPALVELPSLLERRIIAMTPTAPRYRGLRLGTAAAFAALLFVAACELTPRSVAPSPTEPTLAEVLGAEEEPTASGATASRAPAPEDLVVITRNGDADGATIVFTEEGDTLRPGVFRVRTTANGRLSTGDADPVVLVDGVRVESVSTVDPTRIRSIEVLKGEAALAAYGPEAADGLIRVTTGTPESRPRTPQPVEAPADVERGAAVAPVAQIVEEVVAVGYGARPPMRATAPTPAAEREVVDAVGYGTRERAAATRVVAPTIRIRGARAQGENPTANAPESVAQGEPLILVDGEVVSSLADLKERFEPGEIASISVLKDASALEAYGARARHGAIIVTLKK